MESTITASQVHDRAARADDVIDIVDTSRDVDVIGCDTPIRREPASGPDGSDSSAVAIRTDAVVACKGVGRMEQQRGLPDPWLAADEERRRRAR